MVSLRYDTAKTKTKKIKRSLIDFDICVKKKIQIFFSYCFALYPVALLLALLSYRTSTVDTNIGYEISTNGSKERYSDVISKSNEKIEKRERQKDKAEWPMIKGLTTYC